MSLPIKLDRKRPKKILYRASKISSEEVESRATRISSEWTYKERTERKRIGAARRDWLSRLINRSSNDHE